MGLISNQCAIGVGIGAIGHGLRHAGISLTGLSSFQGYAPAARVGNHTVIMAVSSGSAISDYNWSSVAPGRVDLGQASHPSDFTAADTGDPDAPAQIYYAHTVDGALFEGSVAIRRLPAKNIAAPTLTAEGLQSDTLTTTDGNWLDDEGGFYSYQWQREGLDLPDATAHTYNRSAAAGTFRCIVTFTNSGGRRQAVSDVLTFSQTSAPMNLTQPVLTGDFGLGGMLAVSDGIWSALPDVAGYSYQWQRDAVPISGATMANYVVALADSATLLTCVVTATNSVGSSDQVSDGRLIDTFAAPVISGFPTVQGSPQVGATLTTYAADVMANPSASRTWQWNRDGSPISGAIGMSYTLQTADVGAKIVATQIETSVLGTTAANSSPTATIVSNGIEPPEIIAVTTDVQNNGDLPLSLTLSEACNIDYVISGSPSAPTPLQVSAGQNDDGANAADSGTIQIPTGGPFAADMSQGLSDFYYIHMNAHDGSGLRSDDVDTVGPVNIDTLPPILSGAGVANIGGTTALASVTSDTVGGVLYTGILAEGFFPSPEDIRTGMGAVFHASTSPIAGINSLHATGLTPSTAYRWHFVHEDAQFNRSAALSTVVFSTDVVGSSNTVSAITGSPESALVGTDQLYRFVNDGSFVADGDFIVRYLVVAGGGSGADNSGLSGGGGGGAGEMLRGSFQVVLGQAYTIAIGVGGDNSADSKGGDSGLVGANAPGVAEGGGYGGTELGMPGAGGSGGGAGGVSGHVGGVGRGVLGHDGGSSTANGEGAGGGGAGGPGEDDTGNPTYQPGSGGVGIADDITGSNVIYASGGAGAAASATQISGTDGVNIGDGGQGGQGGASGGNGAPGVVIVRFTP